MVYIALHAFGPKVMFLIYIVKSVCHFVPVLLSELRLMSDKGSRQAITTIVDSYFIDSCKLYVQSFIIVHRDE